MNSKKIILTYGSLFGGLSLLLLNIRFYTGYLYENSFTTRVIFDIPPIFIMLFCIFMGIYVAKNQYRKQVVTFSSQSQMSFSQMLKIGMGITLIGALMIATYHLVFITFIDPEFVQKSMDIQLKQMLLIRPEMPEKEYLDIQNSMRKSATPFMQFTLWLIKNLFFGFFISIGISALIKLLPKR